MRYLARRIRAELLRQTSSLDGPQPYVDDKARGVIDATLPCRSRAHFSRQWSTTTVVSSSYSSCFFCPIPRTCIKASAVLGRYLGQIAKHGIAKNNERRQAACFRLLAAPLSEHFEESAIDPFPRLLLRFRFFTRATPFGSAAADSFALRSRGVKSPLMTSRPSAVICKTPYSPPFTRQPWPTSCSIQSRTCRLSWALSNPQVLSFLHAPFQPLAVPCCRSVLGRCNRLRSSGEQATQEMIFWAVTSESSANSTSSRQKSQARHLSSASNCPKYSTARQFRQPTPVQ